MGTIAKLTRHGPARVEQKGRMIFHRPEGDEVFEEGEAYYAGPGHTGEVGLPGTLIVEFSPSDEYAQTMAAWQGTSKGQPPDPNGQLRVRGNRSIPAAP